MSDEIVLQELYVRNFRNIKSATLQFSCDINHVFGKNAQGKTSLLEAIFFCMSGMSFRTSSLKQLIRHDEPGFYLEARFKKLGVYQTLSISFEGKKRRVALNMRPCQSTSIILGLLQGVVCTPEDLQLIKGPPQVRRRFLDLHISQFEPLYVHHLNRFRRALRQRNALLRSQKMSLLSIFEYELARSGAYIAHKRKEACEAIKKYAQNHAKEMNLYSFDLCYAPSIEICTTLNETLEHYRELLSSKRQHDSKMHSTEFGPHRDDIDLLFNERPLQEVASEGQSRLCALALKFSEWDVLKNKIAMKPLLLIDDVVSCLDSEKRERLVTFCSGFGQTFITSHEPLHHNSKRYFVESGQFVVHR